MRLIFLSSCILKSEKGKKERDINDDKKVLAFINMSICYMERSGTNRYIVFLTAIRLSLAMFQVLDICSLARGSKIKVIFPVFVHTR